MGVYQNLMDQLGDKGALFNVTEHELQTVSGISIPNRKVIINESTERPIGIVSKNYKVVPNIEIFDGFCKSIENSNINSEDATVNVSFSPNGGKTLVDFQFPNESFTVQNDSSSTILNIAALNSFDGSTRYITKAGGFRLKCMNGQIIGDIAGAYSSTHTNRLNVEEGAQKVIRMVEEFNSAKDYWSVMMQKPLRRSSPEASRVIEEFLSITPKTGDKLPKTFYQIQDLHETYAREFGDNVYALYNALTDFVTHKQTKTAANGRLNRENRLQKLMKNNRTFASV